MSGEFHIARMRSVAACLPAVVSAGDGAGFSRLMARATDPGDMLALIRLLAEAADPERLAEVTGCRVPARLREMHAAYERLRKAGKHMPAYVRAGEREYQNYVKRAQRRTAAGERAA